MTGKRHAATHTHRHTHTRKPYKIHILGNHRIHTHTHPHRQSRSHSSMLLIEHFGHGYTHFLHLLVLGLWSHVGTCLLHPVRFCPTLVLLQRLTIAPWPVAIFFFVIHLHNEDGAKLRSPEEAGTPDLVNTPPLAYPHAFSFKSVRHHTHTHTQEQSAPTN